MAVALNYQNIKYNPERKPRIEHFIDQYNWKEISFSSHTIDWKRCESNKIIACIILHISQNRK